jgi:hypothetical protein
VTLFAVLLGIVYLAVGTAKLVGVKPIAVQFDEFGLGRTGMRAVGALEVAAAIGLQIDGLDVFAAGGMVLTMLGALYQHRKSDHRVADMAPALVVLVGSALFLVLSI